MTLQRALAILYRKDDPPTEHEVRSILITLVETELTRELWTGGVFSPPEPSRDIQE